MRSTPLNGSYYPGAITILYNNPTLLHGIDISLNALAMLAPAGIGIDLLNTNQNVRLTENAINFYTNNPYSGNILASGIYANQCNGTVFQLNIIRGNLPILTGPASPFVGLYLLQSINSIIDCNRFFDLPVGLRADGNCQASSVLSNKFTTMGNGIRCNDFTVAGTLGNIGSLSFDSRNRFNQSSLASSPQNFDIYRMTTSPLPPPTYYGDMTWAFFPTSGSFTPNTAYLTQSNTGAPFMACANDNIPVLMLAPQSSADDMPLEEALAIAQDSVTYIDLEPGCKWLDQRRLYTVLAGDSLLRISQSELQNFYNQMQNEKIKDLVYIDKLLQGLSDTTHVADSLYSATILQQATSLNAGIVSSNPLEQNEVFINTYFIQWLQSGWIALDSTQQSQIEMMARSCPYINGRAVYKARTLYAALGGYANYDDWSICHSAGLYRSSGYNYPSIQLPQDGMPVASAVKLYPNPAQDRLTVQCVLGEQETALFILYDLLGHEQARMELSYEQDTRTLSIGHLPAGLYLYQCRVGPGTSYSGKLIKD
ncbi:MAG: T9SS type A sorting domain-containing protein [Chitinophagaceae bacterium]